jgi:DNA processing protein
MADAVIVVESKLKGGSLITAQMAQDYSRDVFALPGRYNDSLSEGCNRLIQSNRAQLIAHAEDLIAAMQWQIDKKQPLQTIMLDVMHDLTDRQQHLFNKLQEQEDGWHVNQLVIETQLSYSDIVAELMVLEVNGLVRGLPGGMWRCVER